MIKPMTNKDLARLDKYLKNGDPVKDMDDEITLIEQLRERLRVVESKLRKARADLEKP